MGEDKYLLTRMFFRQKFVKFGQLVILVSMPLAREFEDGKKSLGVLPEMLSKVFDKYVRAQPIKIAGVFGAERLVARCSGFGKIGQGLGSDFGWLCCRVLVRAEEGAVAVMVFGAGIEQRGILCPTGSGRPFSSACRKI